VIAAMIILLSGCRFDLQEPRDSNDAPLAISKIRGNLYLVEDSNYWKTNHVFYVTPNGAVFINSGWTGKSANQVLWKAATLTYAEFTAVVPTGYRLHYAGGLAFFRRERVPIYVSAKTQKLIRARWDAMQEDMSSFGTWHRESAPDPDHVFDDEISFLEGAINIFHPGPASSEDNLLAYFPKERVLYGGDMISDPAYFLDQIPAESYKRALMRALALPFDIVISGHGKAIQDRDFVIRKLRALDRVL